MNSCPYYLVTAPTITKLADLKNKTVACREGPSRNTPIAETFRNLAQLDVGKNLTLQMLKGDQDAFNLLIDGKVDGAFLPRPFGFIAEERGFNRLSEWPDVVDDPLPITIETSEKLWRENADDFRKFLAAHQEGIRYFKSHPDDAIRILTKRFGHSESLAKKTCKDYIVCMVKFSGVSRQQSTRVYDDIIGTFTRSGAVDDETQRNDLNIIRQVTSTNESMPNARAYDFSFALEADQQLNKMGWKP